MDFALLVEEAEAAASTAAITTTPMLPPRRQSSTPRLRPLMMRRRRRPFQAGDLAIVVERHDSYVPVYLRAGEKHMNRVGAFHHDDIIGRPFGSKVNDDWGMAREQDQEGGEGEGIHTPHPQNMPA
jgi:hypothetical protein